MAPARLFLALSLAPGLLAQWGPVVAAGAPAGRTGALLACDVPNARMLLFGGNWTNEFWAYQNGAWTQLQPAVLPGPRERAAVAVDPLAGTIVLYGGDTPNSQFAADETWLWDGLGWAQLAPNGTPGGIARHAMAFDAARQVAVLFGGRRNSWAFTQVLDETWQFANGAWTRAFPSTSPPGRAAAAMAYLPAVGQVLLFGGHDGNDVPLDDSWLFDGVAWTQVSLTGPKPSARAHARMDRVLTRGTAVLVGGFDTQTMAIANDTWEHDGAQWRQVTGTYGGVYPPRAEFAMAHDLVRDRLVLFGGRIANTAVQNDTWEFGAQFQRFGSGCAGSNGVPQLAAGAPPRLGQTTTAVLSNLAAGSGIALVAVGWSRQQWPLGNLPALLTGFGLPGCRVYTSCEVFTAIPASAGTAVWSWNVPAVPGFLGEAFHLQGLSLDPGLNAAGAAVSNAATIVLGG